MCESNTIKSKKKFLDDKRLPFESRNKWKFEEISRNVILANGRVHRRQPNKIAAKKRIVRNITDFLDGREVDACPTIIVKLIKDRLKDMTVDVQECATLDEISSRRAFLRNKLKRLEKILSDPRYDYPIYDRYTGLSDRIDQIRLELSSLKKLQSSGNIDNVRSKMYGDIYNVGDCEFLVSNKRAEKIARDKKINTNALIKKRHQQKIFHTRVRNLIKSQQPQLANDASNFDEVDDYKSSAIPTKIVRQIGKVSDIGKEPRIHKPDIKIEETHTVVETEKASIAAVNSLRNKKANAEKVRAEKKKQAIIDRRRRKNNKHGIRTESSIAEDFYGSLNVLDSMCSEKANILKGLLSSSQFKSAVEKLPELFSILAYLIQLWRSRDILDYTSCTYQFLYALFGNFKESLRKYAQDFILKSFKLWPTCTEGKIGNTLEFFESRLGDIMNSALLVSIRNFLCSMLSFKLFDRDTTKSLSSVLGSVQNVSLIEFVPMVLTALTQVVKFGEAVIEGVPLNAYFALENPSETAMSDAQLLLTREDNLSIGIVIPGRMEIREYLIKLKDIKNVLESCVNNMRVFDPRKLKIQNCLIKVTRSLELVSNRLLGSQRDPPFGLIIHGAPGVGKSVNYQHLCKLYCDVKGVPYVDQIVFHRTASSQYMDMYDPLQHLIIHYSELANKKSTLVRTQGDDILNELVSICDSIAHPVDTAALESKGKVFAIPELVIADTNTPDLNASYVSNAPAAILRRFVFLEVILKPAFVKDGTKTLDRDKLKAYADAGGDTLDIWYFNVVKKHAASNVTTTDEKLLFNGDFKEMQVLMRSLFEEHLRHNTFVRDTVNVKQDSPVFTESKQETPVYHFDTSHVPDDDPDPIMWAIGKKIWSILKRPFEALTGGPFSCNLLLVVLYWFFWSSFVFPFLGLCRTIRLLDAWYCDRYLVVTDDKDNNIRGKFFVYRCLDFGSIIFVTIIGGFFFMVIRVLGAFAVYMLCSMLGRIGDVFAGAAMTFIVSEITAYFTCFNKEKKTFISPLRKHIGKYSEWSVHLTLVAALWATMFAGYYVLKPPSAEEMEEDITDIVTETDVTVFHVDSDRNRSLSNYEELLETTNTVNRIPIKHTKVWNNITPVIIPSICKNDVADLNNIVRRNCRSALIVGQKQRRTKVFGVKGDMALVNKHNFTDPIDGRWHIVISLGNLEDENAHTRDIIVTINELVEVSPDVVLVRLNSVMFKDILSYVIPHFKNLTGSRNAFIADINVRSHKRDSPIPMNNGGGETIVVPETLVYDFEDHLPGFCGTPLVIETGPGYCIAGIHAGGSQHGSECFAAIFTRDNIENAIRIMGDRTYKMEISSEGMVIEKPLTDLHRKSPFRFEYLSGITVYGGIDGKKRTFGKSRVVISPCAKQAQSILGLSVFTSDGYPRFAAPAMKPFVRDNEYYSPINRALKKMDRSDRALDPYLLEKVYNELSQRFSNISIEVSPLNLETAINGVKDDPETRRINASTAGGFKYPGTKDKWIPIVKEGVYVVREPIDEVKSDILDAYKYYDKEQTIDCVYKAALKDEPRPYAKCQTASTRVFYACSLRDLIVARQFLYPFFALFPQYPDIFCSAIGIDMHASSDKFVNNLIEFSSKFMEGDYEAYDQKQLYEIRLLVFSLIYNFLKDKGYNDTALRMTKCVLTQLLFPTVDMFDDLIQVPGIQPSGSFGTAEINCLVNLVMLMVCYYARNPHGDFFKNVKPVTYGDDIIAAVKPQALGNFNNIFYQDFCKQVFNINFTPATKNATMASHLELSEISFLKRTFSYNCYLKRYVAKLDIYSILKSLTVYIPSKSVSEEKQIVDTVISSCYEYFFHCDDNNSYEIYRLSWIKWIEFRYGVPEAELEEMLPSGSLLYQKFSHSL